ncbi:MAG: transcriptional regulator [Mesorhizobium sp.]|nr:MAG: transcriptional regulator [Mesorhizobium sp.]
MINAEQMRAARALLDWTRDDLAERSGVSAPTIKLMETRGTERSVIATVNAVQVALEEAGVAFIPENGGGAGVRRREPSQPRNHP